MINETNFGNVGTVLEKATAGSDGEGRNKGRSESVPGVSSVPDENVLLHDSVKVRIIGVNLILHHSC